MKLTLSLLVSLILSFSMASVLLAQVPDPFAEDHFKVYEATPDYVYPGSVILLDQFGILEGTGETTVNNLWLDKFATPVIKNNENNGEYFDEVRHQTWWRFDEPQPIRRVDLVNQFGPQVWLLGNAKYLVLPALKFLGGKPLVTGPPLPVTNHYKCYEATGPDPTDEFGNPRQVTLMDQFGPLTYLVTTPEYFCNPVEKTVVGGPTHDIVNTAAHLACYRIAPSQVNVPPLLAQDQFGDWDLELTDDCWLCVPTDKIQAVGTEQSTWGRIKKQFYD